MYTCVGMHSHTTVCGGGGVSTHLCGHALTHCGVSGWGTTCKSLFSLSTVWVPGIRFRFSGLGQTPAEPSHLPSNVFFSKRANSRRYGGSVGENGQNIPHQHTSLPIYWYIHLAPSSSFLSHPPSLGLMFPSPEIFVFNIKIRRKADWRHKWLSGDIDSEKALIP